MNKQLIGVFRVVVYLVIVIFFSREIDSINFKYWVSDLIYGSHSVEFRSKTIIDLIMVIYYGILSFYIIQTVFYIVIGGALTGKNTSLLRFLRILVRDIREVAQTPSYWFGSGPLQTDQIVKVLQYRDNRMSIMSNADAVEYSRGTGHVEQMMTRPDLKQNKKVLSYMNNRMAFMTFDDALNYMKGNK
jgi:hypothetical protein